MKSVLRVFVSIVLLLWTLAGPWLVSGCDEKSSGGARNTTDVDLPDIFGAGANGTLDGPIEGLDSNQTALTPEPATVILLLAGAAGLAAYQRRRRGR